MRRTFFDILENLEFDIKKEYDELLYLFRSENAVFFRREWITLCNYIDKAYFRDLPFRGRFTSVVDMMDELRLDDLSDDLNDLFTFCEFLEAVMPQNSQSNTSVDSQCEVIRDNIKNILDKTNHELIRSSKYGDKYIIIEKNKAAMLSAEIVEDEEIAFELLEYNHYTLKGNLTEKKKILHSIGTYIEPILRDETLSKAGYGNLESNVGFLLNKFHIRHNNKEGATAQEYIVSINDDELEKWYDRTYDVLIQAILTNENIAVEKDIKQLKRDYKWR